MIALHKPQSQYDTLLHNLRALMQKAHINEAELSRKTNIPQATLHKILSGKTEDPRASTLKLLADFFGITIDALLSGSSNTSTSSNLAEAVQSVPVLSWKDCADAENLVRTLTPSNWKDWEVTTFLGKNVFALISKPSMTPRFPKGTILFADLDEVPQDGDYVVVLYPQTEEATLREFSIDGPTKILLPINPNSNSTALDEKTKIIGVLMKSSFSY